MNESIIQNFLPIINLIIFGAMIISVVKSLISGKIKDIVLIICVCCLILYVANHPTILERFGKYTFDYVEKLGVDINEGN